MVFKEVPPLAILLFFFLLFFYFSCYWINNFFSYCRNSAHRLLHIFIQLLAFVSFFPALMIKVLNYLFHVFYLILNPFLRAIERATAIACFRDTFLPRIPSFLILRILAPINLADFFLPFFLLGFSLSPIIASISFSVWL